MRRPTRRYASVGYSGPAASTLQMRQSVSRTTKGTIASVASVTSRLVNVASPPTTAVHPDPAWRDRANYIIRADLTAHGMAGHFEQLWARTEDQQHFEICCIPFFTYGIALGDIVTWDPTNDLVEVTKSSGHRNIRIAFLDKSKAAASHQTVHGALVSEGCTVEFSSDGYGAIDIDTATRADTVPALLAPWVSDGTLIWEWAAS
jgi:hypothetical protein